VFLATILKDFKLLRAVGLLVKRLEKKHEWIILHVHNSLNRAPIFNKYTIRPSHKKNNKRRGIKIKGTTVQRSDDRISSVKLFEFAFEIHFYCH
jgi:hypothetical protein